MKLAAALFLLAAPFAFAQAASTAILPALASSPSAKPLAFEVASIHVHQGPIQSFMDFSSSGPRVRLAGYNLRGLVMEAYNLRSFQVIMPGIEEHQDTNYDIAAIAPDNTTPTRDDFRRMLQTLLADRFQLKARFEKKPMPVYALVVAKGGSKLAPATAAEQHKVIRLRGRNKILQADSITMPDLANLIWDGFISDRPVVDQTGLTGSYKLHIEATPEFRMAANAQPGGLSIFTAVQEQLGLKLQPTTVPLDALVIDSAQKPTPN